MGRRAKSYVFKPYVVKGEKRGRSGWIVDYHRLVNGEWLRTWKAFKTEEAAEEYRDQVAQQLRGLGDDGAEDFDISLGDFAKRRFLPEVKAVRKPRTYASYEETVRLHLKPLGDTRIRELSRRRITAFLVGKLSSGLSRGTVLIIYAVLRRLLSVAVRDGLLLANPPAKLGNEFRLVPSARQRQDQIKAFDETQLQAFMSATRRVSPAYVPLFAMLAGGGLRLGEALGLEWADLNFADNTIHVQRTLAPDGQVGTPKVGHGRIVALSEQLSRLLRRLQMALPTRMKRHRWTTAPAWVFCTRSGKPIEAHNARKVFRKCVKAAGLPKHHSPHSLRHTFASLLLQAGESPQYVQEQLGHASLTITTQVYGKWLPKRPVRGGVNLLGELLCSNPVAGPPSKLQKRAKLLGEPSRDRTEDPLIKSQVLCRLS
jgi:integrase